MKIGITFASVHEEYAKDPLQALDEIKDAGYELFEVSPFESFNYEDYAKALKERGIRPIAGHYGWDSFDDDKIDDSIAHAKLFGLEMMIMPWCPPESIASYDETVATAKKLDAMAEKLAKYGYPLLFHNHIIEFENIYNGKSVMEIFYENTSLLGFELDLGWGYAGGCDLVPFINKLGNRLKTVHIKDVNADCVPVEVGTGLVNMKECLDAAVVAGVKYGIVEQDVATEKRIFPPFESIRISRDNLRKMGY